MSRAIALLVDFDNAYISLKNASKSAAAAFGRRPEIWLDWFASGGHRPGEAGAADRVLVRRCFLNPKPFGEFRTHYVGAGFQTIDCPSLTGMGKNSADIIMALDVVDLITHPTRFDEFIILSGDADFTPVLLKLREHGRETTVLANPLASAALKAAATHVVEIDNFIEDALGIDVSTEPVIVKGPVQRAPLDSRDQEVIFLADILIEEIGADGPVQLNRMAQVILERYPPFKDSDWLGFGTLRALANAIALADRRLVLKIDGVDDRFSLAEGSGPAGPKSLSEEETATLRADVLDHVARRLDEAAAPIHGSALGLEIVTRFGPEVKSSNWLGAGTLKRLVGASDDPRIAISTQSGGAVFYHPERHQGQLGPEMEETRQADNLAHEAPEIAAFVERLAGVGWPPLGAKQHQLVLKMAEEEIAAGVIDRSPLSAAIRDRITAQIEAGELPPALRVSRVPINFILNGLIMNGAEFGVNCSTEDELRGCLRGSLRTFMQNRLGEPEPGDDRLIDLLIGTPPGDGVAAAAPPPFADPGGAFPEPLSETSPTVGMAEDPDPFDPRG